MYRNDIHQMWWVVQSRVTVSQNRVFSLTADKKLITIKGGWDCTVIRVSSPPKRPFLHPVGVDHAADLLSPRELLARVVEVWNDRLGPSVGFHCVLPPPGDRHA